MLNARAKEQEQARRVVRALKRLRNSKPPYPIFRRRAHVSIVQHELAAEQIRALVGAASAPKPVTT